MPRRVRIGQNVIRENRVQLAGAGPDHAVAQNARHLNAAQMFLNSARWQMQRLSAEQMVEQTKSACAREREKKVHGNQAIMLLCMI